MTVDKDDKDDNDHDDDSGDVWWFNFYGAWSSNVPCAYAQLA